jgi:hypothetical protein
MNHSSFDIDQQKVLHKITHKLKHKISIKVFEIE